MAGLESCEAILDKFLGDFFSTLRISDGTRTNGRVGERTCIEGVRVLRAEGLSQRSRWPELGPVGLTYGPTKRKNTFLCFL